MKVAFLDRDGTLIKDKHYLSDVNGIEFYNEAISLLKALQRKNFKFIIVTNQSGIARGLITGNQLNLINKKIEMDLSHLGIMILKTYSCPEKSEHPWRKSRPGMLLQAGLDFNINYSQSIVIGDKESDIHSGEKLGMKAFKLKNGNLESGIEDLF